MHEVALRPFAAVLPVADLVLVSVFCSSDLQARFTFFCLEDPCHVRFCVAAFVPWYI